jgi:hypothetical protein
MVNMRTLPRLAETTSSRAESAIGNPELETLPATLRNQLSSGATRALPLFGAAELT